MELPIEVVTLSKVRNQLLKILHFGCWAIEYILPESQFVKNFYCIGATSKGKFYISNNIYMYYCNQMWLSFNIDNEEMWYIVC